jgi:Na+-transporting methylmalonyl-CoA/oxaloacetate decarboxylase gamma subunit
MKKLVLFALFAVALSGLTMAQTTPKPAKKEKAKKEATAPVQGETKKDTATAHHHHQKHAKPKQGK